MATHWKRFMFKMNEFHGELHQDVEIEKADIHAYFQQSQLIQKSSIFTIHRSSHTWCIDLHNTLEEMRKDMNRTTRYQINKGSRDALKLVYIHEPIQQDIEDFADFFNPFAVNRGIDKCRVDKLRALKEKDMLLFTYVLNKDDVIFAAHAYIIHQKRASMFYSCSGRFNHDTNIPGTSVSRANRYMHWRNIIYFKEKGFNMYDFMGMSTNPNDEAGEKLNRFKRGFGGEERAEYQSFIPQNLKGKLLIIILKYLWRKNEEIIKPNQTINQSIKS